jgi:ubiquinone biosynthesis protein Coq4
MIWKIRLVWALIRATMNPENTTAILTVGEAMYHIGATETARAKMMSQPDVVEVIKSRKQLAPVNLQELQKLPPGTLGRAYADHMIGNNLNPNFYKNLEITNDYVMTVMRLRQTHDLWHVVTGFSTSVEDELGLQAFMFAQTASPLPPLLIGLGILKSGLKTRHMTQPILDRVSLGWMMGKKAKALFPIDWEANWQTPLSQLRQDYNVDALS